MVLAESKPPAREQSGDASRRSAARRRYAAVALVITFSLALWLLNVSRPGVRAEGCAEGCSGAGQRREGPLRVMSLNVLHDFPRFRRLSERLNWIADEIRRHDADVVFLQEVPWTLRLGGGASYLARRAGLNDLCLRANGNRRAILFEEGVAILSRYPLEYPAPVELRPRVGVFEHRVALHATAVTPWGDLRLFVTHLAYRDEGQNRRQAEALRAFVESTGTGSAVVAGDLNAREDTLQIRALADAWVDAYRSVHPDDRGLTCCIDDLARESSESLTERIDYVFLVPGAEPWASVRSARRVLTEPFPVPGGWLWPSDHVGLLVEIELPGQGR